MRPENPALTKETQRFLRRDLVPRGQPHRTQLVPPGDRSHLRLLSLMLPISISGAFPDSDPKRAERHRPDDPGAKWDCPRCGALMPNTHFACVRCHYRLN